jgi:ABC-type glycerol-3-phosphate transport system substrate-binding protein
MFFLACTVVWAGGQQETGSSEGGAPITITHFQHTQPPYDEIIRQMAQDFSESHENINVEVQFYASADLATKIRTTLLAGGELDTFSVSSFESAWFMENDAAAPIDPAAFDVDSREAVVDMWQDGAVKSVGGVYDGEYYGLPYEMSNYVAWMNTAHMEEAGLDPQQDMPETWSEFVSVAEELTVRENGNIVRNGFATNLKAAVFPFLILHSMMQQQGLDWSTESGFLESLNSQEAVTALETFTDFATEDGIFNPGLFDNEREGFGNGLTSTFLTGGTWYWGVLDEYSVAREDVEPFPYPRFQGGENIGGPVYGYSTFVASQSENQEAAWEWVNFFLSRPEEFIVHGLFQPRETLDEDLVAESIADSEVFLSELESGAPLLASPHFNEVQDAVGQAVSSVVFEGVDPEAAIERLRTEAQSILE